MQFALAPFYLILLGPTVFFSTLFLNTLSMCFGLSARDEVSHPYKVTGDIKLFMYFNLYTPR